MRIGSRPAFALAAVLAMITALALGLVNRDASEPFPRQTLRPGGSAEVAGIRYSIVSFGVTEIDPGFSEPPPDGTVWLRLVVRQEVLVDPQDDPYCRMTLITDRGRWPTDFSGAAVRSGWETSCISYEEEMVAGLVREISGVWLVPADYGADPRIMMKFDSPTDGVLIRPLG